MMKFSTAIIDLFPTPNNVFSCEHYSEAFIWGTLLSTGVEMKVAKTRILRQATINEMSEAYEYRYKGRNRICGKNQPILGNM